MADETPPQDTEAQATPAPNAATEAARLFGTPAAPQPAPGGNGAAPPMPDGLIEKYWTGDMEAYARAVTQGYTHLNGEYTKATQQLGGDAPGEVADAYWAERTQEAFAAQYPKLDFEDMEGVRDVYRAAHAQGLGPKRANALVDAYLARRNATAPEVETDEARRSRVIHELGPQGASMAAAVGAWVTGSGFTGEEVAAMAPLAEDPVGIRVLFKLSRSSLTAPPSGQGPMGHEMERRQAVAQVRKELAECEGSPSADLIARYTALTQPGRTLDGQPVPDLS